MNRSFVVRYIAPLMLLMAAILVTGCEREPEKREVTPASMGQEEPTGTIVALGDSLTAGLGVDEEEAYPAQLARKLAAAGHRYTVINSGVSGETTSGTVSRLDWVLTLAPDIVILEIGANDGLRGIDPAIPARNLRTIVQRLKEEDIVCRLLVEKKDWNLGPLYTAKFNGIYPEIAEEEELIFMEFFLQDVAMVRELNIEDGLHPNGEGYGRVVENLYPYVEEAIRVFEERQGLR